MDSLQIYNRDLLFGSNSNIISSSPTTYPLPHELAGSTLFDLSSLLLFVMYIYLLYYFRGYIFASIRSIFHDSTDEKLIEESGFIFNRYVIVSSIMGLLTLGLLSIKFIYELLPLESGFATLPIHIDILLAIYLSIIICIRIFQISIIRLCCLVIDSPSLSHCLLRHNRLNLTIVSLIILPFFLLISQFSFSESPIIVISTLILLIGAIILHIYRSCKFFIRENISILYTILYLCIVDLFPISFMVLLIVKHL